VIQEKIKLNYYLKKAGVILQKNCNKKYIFTLVVSAALVFSQNTAAPVSSKPEHYFISREQRSYKTRKELKKRNENCSARL